MQLSTESTIDSFSDTFTITFNVCGNHVMQNSEYIEFMSKTINTIQSQLENCIEIIRDEDDIDDERSDALSAILEPIFNSVIGKGGKG